MALIEKINSDFVGRFEEKILKNMALANEPFYCPVPQGKKIASLRIEIKSDGKFTGEYFDNESGVLLSSMQIKPTILLERRLTAEKSVIQSLKSITYEVAKIFSDTKQNVNFTFVDDNGDKRQVDADFTRIPDGVRADISIDRVSKKKYFRVFAGIVSETTTFVIGAV